MRKLPLMAPPHWFWGHAKFVRTGINDIMIHSPLIVSSLYLQNDIRLNSVNLLLIRLMHGGQKTILT